MLHRVGGERQGPFDSTTSDRLGRFSFAFRSDSGVFYLLSARRAGIEYFSPPVATNPARPDTAVRIVVYDTSSQAVVRLEARHLVLTRPGEDGSRGVLDLIVLRNDGTRTRVARDTTQPSWVEPLLSGSIGLDVGEGDFSEAAVTRAGDSLLITAAIAPGEKQLTLQYQIPAGRSLVQLPLTQPRTVVNVLIEEPGVTVTAPGITLADTQVIQGRSFRRWTGTVPAAEIVDIRLPDTLSTPRWLLAALVVVLGLALSGVGWFALSRRQPVRSSVAAEHLLDAIARLDNRYLGREGETPAEEWKSYQIERAELKARLEATLAAGGWRR